MNVRVIVGLLTLAVLSGGRVVQAQEQAPPAGRPDAASGSSGSPSAAPNSPAQAIDESIEAGEADAKPPARSLVAWNHYEGSFFTIRVGGGLLFDYATYKQDNNSKQQFDLSPEFKVRDFRVLLKGQLKFKRQVSWSSGLMYDGASAEWLVRETGIMVAVPEIWGHVFVGRTKEGFSLNKVMAGYAGWTMERAMISDATIPILADGFKWLGYLPKKHLLWNLGFYGDSLSEGQSFSTYGRQIAGRLAWVHLLSNDSRRLIHLGINGRVGTPKDDVLRLRSRPETNPAPYFVDTAEFAAMATTMTSIEADHRPGSWLFGTEYFFQSADAPQSGNPLFHGGDAVATWLVTGETRTYNTRGGFFNQVSPARPVFQGGPGAWELVTRFSYIDLDDHAVRGGTFWRFTPMVNWYLSDHVRLEMAYGYGSLNRFSLVGKTQFFQTRLQLQL